MRYQAGIRNPETGEIKIIKLGQQAHTGNACRVAVKKRDRKFPTWVIVDVRPTCTPLYITPEIIGY